MVRLPILVAIVFFAVVGALMPAPVAAQEPPYFVAYTHHLEEPDSLEVELFSNFGVQPHGNNFLAPWMEFEYGATGWWTTEFYLDSQSTFGENTFLTGFRWENRFRPLMREHWINPVLYVEYESINGADKTMKEVVGFDNAADHAVPTSIARREHDHEIETKLILSSNFRGWNIAENFIAEKNLNGNPWEFGYAVGLSRPLRLAATASECRLCRENFVAGIEFYGGLGTAQQFTLSHTSQYVAPVLSWELPSGARFSLSPGWGITSPAHPFLLRWGVSYEISGFGHKVRNLLR